MAKKKGRPAGKPLSPAEHQQRIDAANRRARAELRSLIRDPQPGALQGNIPASITMKGKGAGRLKGTTLTVPVPRLPAAFRGAKARARLGVQAVVPEGLRQIAVKGFFRARQQSRENFEQAKLNAARIAVQQHLITATVGRGKPMAGTVPRQGFKMLLPVLRKADRHSKRARREFKALATGARVIWKLEKMKRHIQ